MVDPDVAERFRTELLEWTAEHEREFSWRDPDVGFYEMFMSEMFLRRTRADVVESFIPEFFEHYPSLSALRTADQDELASVIRPMGLQNKRAKGLLELAAQVDGETLPRDRESLLTLPQVGPYVANAALCFGLDQQLPIVDRNVDRVYRRVFGEDWETLADDTERYAFAERMLPEGQARLYNLGLLDFASLVCTAKAPECERCFASDYCTYYAQVVEGDQDADTDR